MSTNVNSTNGSKPCKQTFICAGKRGMSYSLFISSVRDWDTCRGHLRIKNLRYFLDIIQQGCSPESDVQRRLNTWNQKSRCINTKLCRNKAPVEHILRINEASQGTENNYTIETKSTSWILNPWPCDPCVKFRHTTGRWQDELFLFFVPGWPNEVETSDGICPTSWLWFLMDWWRGCRHDSF